jgi:hypothetical protein
VHPHRCHVTNRARRACALATIVVAVVGTAGAVGGPAGAREPAHAASSLLLNEHATLRLLNRHGIVFNEQGPQSGSLGGTLTLRITARVTAIYVQWSSDPSGGTMHGEGKTNAVAEGAVGRVTGSMNITGGSGRYSHAHASGLRVTGTINRHNYTLTIHVTGWMYY